MNRFDCKDATSREPQTDRRSTAAQQEAQELDTLAWPTLLVRCELEAKFKQNLLEQIATETNSLLVVSYQKVVINIAEAMHAPARCPSPEFLCDGLCYFTMQNTRGESTYPNGSLSHHISRPDAGCRISRRFFESGCTGTAQKPSRKSYFAKKLLPGLMRRLASQADGRTKGAERAALLVPGE